MAWFIQIHLNNWTDYKTNSNRFSKFEQIYQHCESIERYLPLFPIIFIFLIVFYLETNHTNLFSIYSMTVHSFFFFFFLLLPVYTNFMIASELFLFSCMLPLLSLRSTSAFNFLLEFIIRVVDSVCNNVPFSSCFLRMIFQKKGKFFLSLLS